MDIRTDRQVRLLHEAVLAHRDLWTRGGHHAVVRRQRAVLAAVAAGWTDEELAVALDVLPDDIRLWAMVDVPPALRL